ncbi:DUF4179 domain-containing protein [Clostridium scatologenes]|uniref:DUF4179 domain-containing protein n=1 Tax=Clostridium scatologenes TaxID=1548 RepID=A0A0E3M738_CLOSL|nr:DUF4179 domain-containing protein [Clostridium scatologenes]AKA67334.1 hypothetical protein CSCA_0209 [Clostridium scatologenes]
MDFKPKNGFEQIKVSEKLDDVVEKAIKKAKKDKKKNIIKTKLIKYALAAASISIIFMTSVKFIPVFAEAINNVTIGQAITRELQYYYDKNIGNAVKEGASQCIDESKINKNIKVTINNIVGDDKNLFIFYTLNGKINKEELKNLLLQNFKITDNDDNLLLDSTSNYYSKLPAKLDHKDGDYLLTYNKKYSCVVASLGNSFKNYSKSGESYGCIELSSINGSKIPNELNLEFLSLTEAYKMSYSKNKYEDFFSNFKREPISISGQWKFDINAYQSLKYKKPEVYNNIKFRENSTDFNIKALKIYPTHIEMRIELGKNTINSAQCYSIGRQIIKNEKIDNSKLPYLIDEKGNKYLFADNDLEEMDSDNCLNMNFQSSYFRDSKELYLVINQLNYDNDSQQFSKDIESTKIKIK